MTERAVCHQHDLYLAVDRFRQLLHSGSILSTLHGGIDLLRIGIVALVSILTTSLLICQIFCFVLPVLSKLPIFQLNRLGCPQLIPKFSIALSIGRDAAR